MAYDYSLNPHSMFKVYADQTWPGDKSVWNTKKNAECFYQDLVVWLSGYQRGRDYDFSDETMLWKFADYLGSKEYFNTASHIFLNEELRLVLRLKFGI